MLRALRSGAVDALLLEEPVATRLDRSECDLTLGGTADLPYPDLLVATALPAGAHSTPAVLRRLDFAGLDLAGGGGGVLDRLRAAWVLQAAADCKRSTVRP